MGRPRGGPAEHPAQRELVHRFFAGTGATYDRVVNLCTFGCDRWWKRQILRSVPRGPAWILDQAAGTGILTFLLAARFPAARVVGVELRREYLDRARAKQRRGAPAGVAFLQGRAEDVVLRAPVDCITSSYLAKYAELEPLAANAARMLRAGGAFVAHDFTYPAVRALARVWELHFRLLQSAGRRLHPEWSEAFFGLPALLRQTSWVADLTRALAAHGFEAVRVRRLTGGSAALVTARRGQRTG